jgi:uncharacterized membrane protein
MHFLAKNLYLQSHSGLQVVFMKSAEWAAVAMIVLSFIIGMMAYPYMPGMVASHWGMDGQVNGHMPRFWGVFLLPMVSLAVFLLLFFFVRADPLIRNTKAYKVYPEWIFILIMGFMLYLQILMLAYNLGFAFNFTVWMIPAFAVFFFFLGIVIEKSKRNYTVGIRTPWTLADDQVWQETHLLGGKLFKIVAVLTLIGMFFSAYSIWFFLVPVVAASLIVVIYSYYVYEKLYKNPNKNKGKKA